MCVRAIPASFTFSKRGRRPDGQRGRRPSGLLLGATAGLDVQVAVPLLVLATVVTVADNGLAFTAVAERAGPCWSGRALGVQNTAQFLTAAAVPPLAGLTVTGIGYPATFALAAVFPLAALAMVVLVRDERELT